MAKLSLHESLLVEQHVDRHAKSGLIAYVLWFFLGGVGAHRFYVGRPVSAFAQLILVFGGVSLMAAGVPPLLPVIGGIWLLADLFLIPGMLRRRRERVRETFLRDARRNVGDPPGIDTTLWSARDRARYEGEVGGAD